MHKGILAYVIILIAIAVIGYIEIRGTNLSLFSFLKSSTSTTTIKPNVTQPNYSRSTTISYQSTCNGFSLYNNTPNYSVAAYCTWSGGTLGLIVVVDVELLRKEKKAKLVPLISM